MMSLALLGRAGLIIDVISIVCGAQVYAAGKAKDGSGILLGLHKGQVLRELYRSSDDMPPLTGLWTLPLRHTDTHHSGIALSFTTGSRLLSAGHCRCSQPCAPALVHSLSILE